MARYSIIVGSDKAMFPSLNALFNSLDYIGFKGDVHFILHEDFPLNYLERAKEVFNFDIKPWYFDKKLFDEVFHGEKTAYMKRYRYFVASEISKDYDSNCFLDADLFFVRNIDLFFEIASHGIMIGSAKTSKVRYGGNSSYFVDGKDQLDKPFWNDKGICCCPIFFNKDFKDVFSNVYWGYTRPKIEDRMEASDLFAINLSILKKGAYDRLITLPCHSWVGTNEVMLKPYTRVIEKEGQLISENGDLVYSVHGKWFSKGWHAGQYLHMDRLVDKHMPSKKKYWTNNYKKSMEFIMKWFMKMTSKQKINIFDYSQYLKSDILQFLKEEK